jgi:hypothetical protein
MAIFFIPFNGDFEPLKKNNHSIYFLFFKNNFFYPAISILSGSSGSSGSLIIFILFYQYFSLK